MPDDIILVRRARRRDGHRTMMAKALVRDAPPAAMGLMDSADGLG